MDHFLYIAELPPFLRGCVDKPEGHISIFPLSGLCKAVKLCSLSAECKIAGVYSSVCLTLGHIGYVWQCVRKLFPYNDDGSHFTS